MTMSFFCKCHHDFMHCWLFKNQIMILSKFTWLGNNKIMSFVEDMIRYECVLTVYRKYSTESQGHTSGKL